jgi:hydroxypyruvate isomerase
VATISAADTGFHKGEDGSETASDIIFHELAHAAPRAECCGVTLLIEALSSREADVVTRLSEAVAVVREIRSQTVETIFDVHNTADETGPHSELVSRSHPVPGMFT